MASKVLFRAAVSFGLAQFGSRQAAKPRKEKEKAFRA
jgi:hypothetical protein